MWAYYFVKYNKNELLENKIEKLIKIYKTNLLLLEKIHISNLL